KRCARAVRERAHPVVVQLAGQRSAVIRPAAEIERAVDERVVHWDGAIAEPRARRRCKRHESLADGDRDIFDDVMLEIPGRLDVEPDTCIARERRQHVIEERYRRGDARSGGVGRNADTYSSLGRRSLYGSFNGSHALPGCDTNNSVTTASG